MTRLRQAQADNFNYAANLLPNFPSFILSPPHYLMSFS